MKPIPVVFHLGPIQIHTYGIGLAITFWFAFRYFERRLKRAGYATSWLPGVFIWIVVTAIVGARAVHVLANLHTPLGNGATYLSDPAQMLAIWNGGLSSFGGLLGGVPTGLVLARRRCPELRAVRGMDLVAPVLMAAWGVGRLLGPQLMVNGGGHPTHQWFGMQYANGAGGYTPKELPVPIFQSIESFIIFGVLIAIEHRFRRRPVGFVLAATMALWGLERFAEQHLWLSDPSKAGNVLVQVAGLTLFAAGIVTMVLLWRRHVRGVGASWEDSPAQTVGSGAATLSADDAGEAPALPAASTTLAAETSDPEPGGMDAAGRLPAADHPSVEVDPVSPAGRDDALAAVDDDPSRADRPGAQRAAAGRGRPPRRPIGAEPAEA